SARCAEPRLRGRTRRAAARISRRVGARRDLLRAARRVAAPGISPQGEDDDARPGDAVPPPHAAQPVPVRMVRVDAGQPQALPLAPAVGDGRHGGIARRRGGHVTVRTPPAGLCERRDARGGGGMVLAKGATDAARGRAAGVRDCRDRGGTAGVDSGGERTEGGTVGTDAERDGRGLARCGGVRRRGPRMEHLARSQPEPYQPSLLPSITGSVLSMILRSSIADARRMYARSYATFLRTSSSVWSYFRFTCAQPVMPGSTRWRHG